MNISKITLGTVQLGLEYSINSIKPTLSQSYDILNTAKELGINVLDTARIYGDSEETIGSFLKNNSGLNIVTKFKVDPEKLNDPEIAFLFVRDIQEITSLVIGADSPEQVRQNVHLLNKPKLPEALISEIYQNFSSTPREIITPHLWEI